MGAALHYRPMVKHHYLVGSRHRGEAVSYDYGCATLKHLAKCGLQQVFALCVERRCGLVENQQFGIAQ